MASDFAFVKYLAFKVTVANMFHLHASKVTSLALEVMALQSLATEVSIAATDIRSLYRREDDLGVLFSRVSGLRGHYCRIANIRGRHFLSSEGATVELLSEDSTIE